MLPQIPLCENGVLVPEGVRYKKASRQVNDHARAKLQKLFSDPHKVRSAKDILADSAVLCGPLLWQQIKSLPEMKTIKKGRWIIRVPITGEGSVRGERFLELEGRVFQSTKEIAAFLRAILKTIPQKEKFRIRRPTGPELARYWEMIPYDIEEPIFVAESERHTFLLDFGGNGGKPDRISFVDDYASVGPSQREGRSEKKAR